MGLFRKSQWQHYVTGPQLSETAQMAGIINTAMEAIGGVAGGGFWRVNCDEFLTHILCTFVWKWLIEMHFMRAVVMHCNVCELGCCKVDKSWIKETCKVSTSGIVLTLTEDALNVVYKAVACVLLYVTILQNDIKVENHFVINAVVMGSA